MTEKIEAGSVMLGGYPVLVLSAEACACGLVACAECRERWLGPACRVCGASERVHSYLSGLHPFEGAEVSR